MSFKHIAPYSRPFTALTYCAAFVRPVGLGTGVHVRCLGRFKTAYEARAFAEKNRRPNEELRSVFTKKMALTFLTGMEMTMVEQLRLACRRANKAFSTTSDQPEQPRWIGPGNGLRRAS